jgi:predicted nucleotidyltransferase
MYVFSGGSFFIMILFLFRGRRRGYLTDSVYYNFNPELPEPLNVIHPFQLKAVQQLLASDIPKDVDAIILFGGSLDLTCHPSSDLDLYVLSENPDRMEVYEKMYRVCKPLKKRFDILVSSKADFLDNALELGTVENRLWNKGVYIYAEKESNLTR